MITRINAARAANGLPPLSASVQLANAAARHSGDLASSPWLIDSGRWHEGSDGSTILDRIRREGYEPAQWRENVGWGFGGNADMMFAWWMASPVHRATILSPDVDEVGIGYLYAPGSIWGHYWTADFARRATEPEPARPWVVRVPIAMNGGGAGEDDCL